MDIRDLNIDNYYTLFQGGEDDKDCFVKVISIDPYGVEVKRIDGDEEVISTNCNLLFPIKLTKEILFKNDFVCDDCYAYLNVNEYTYLQYYFYEHRFRKVCEVVDEYENHSKVSDIVFQCDIRYLHTLQNAMRMCGIEKEIKPY